MKKKAIGITLAVIVIALVIVGSSGVYTVRENEYACTVRFSKIINTTGDAGLHFKVPFIDSIKVFPKATMLYDISPSEVTTLDKQNMTVDSYVMWKINDPLKFYQSLGTVSSAEQRLDAITYNAFKNLMSKLAQSDIINEEDASARNDIYSTITANVAEATESYGISIVDVKIKRFDLPMSNENAVYGRMISERNQMAEKYTADGDYEAALIVNDVDKQVNIIISNAEAQAALLEAEGEATYMQMLNDAYNSEDKKDFYEFTLALDALKASLASGDSTVILSSESPLAQILLGALEK
ncbi:MAG: protease modulator HflC [Clostridia bacterium]|nr:protease modulator HflC [Clostridia bacterium]MBR5903125.1 protease modulator HflC [Clostridia bacterium]